MAERKDFIIDKEEFPSNSHKSKEAISVVEEKKTEKIVKGKVTQRKKSLGRRVAEALTGDDTASVGSYIIYDVLIPAAKNTISDIVTGGIEMLLFGESREGNRTTRDRGKSYVSYSSYYHNKKEDRRGVSERRQAHRFDDLIFDNRREAEDVLSRMVDLLDDYQIVTVADLYDLVGMSSNFIDHKWGWENLNTASVVRNRDGYYLKLPRTVPFD